MSVSYRTLSYIYQVYIEPRGTQLLDQDQWKS